MKQIVSLPSIMTMATHGVSAQTKTNNLQRTISNEKGKPLFGISVGIKDTSYGSSADTEGKCLISHVTS
ncbi:hypothetical protein KO507_03205 [Gilvimarinus agarilyticus]|uniref:hypothetical protein n=1 Tax=Reichenbachiella agariperforans TaxID=156994 RepID=UPI001C09D929|nr:hypothetical protein [Reichenbachiella agariperforans]MBU2884769.1 hypothetical protein [Gilvimarinus agarilyticus]MBU2913441.1 hypothetical protein [Reichenbachiella agariperforans]